MKINYNIFFDLMVGHNYYESGWCECLTFQPDPETKQLFKRYQIGISSVAGGFRLYTFGRSITALQKSLTDISSRGYFQLNIICNDASFYNFTELPIDWAGSIEYNIGNTSGQAANGSIILGPTLIPRQQYNYAGKILLNFEDFPSLEEQPRFCIEYTPRATQWQYYVINQSAVELSSPVIEDKQKNTFDGPQQVMTELGQTAMLFSSGDRLLPLSNWPKYKFNLLNRLPPKSQGTVTAATTAKIVFKGLPNPNPDFVSPVLVNNRQQLSSPMYVYL
ncbi:hypothetical protein EWM62_06800 [Mucilaginibacter terrigena]|uniref:Uncharacterized protein n=1 Tax=Mucilaginibacter terrigena TaxID=2492395 RepID=A0A4Q5LQD4_9SPHI|nr:hypothetical protein [Mucilaginibacter terrigena]RYU91642.1 hypothetical protein EWM62_06800 [Mucilaginibacter terrigena]